MIREYRMVYVAGSIGYEVPLFFMYSTTGNTQKSNGNVKKRVKKSVCLPKKRHTDFDMV